MLKNNKKGFLTPAEKSIYQQALKKYGKVSQTIVCIEEASEVQKELTKFLRGKFDRSNLSWEIADMLIMLDQMMLYHGLFSEVEEKKKLKLLRLKTRIEKEEIKDLRDYPPRKANR